MSSCRDVCEKLKRENNALTGKAGETAMAVQWRERYEAVLKERESYGLRDKRSNSDVSITSSFDGTGGGGGGEMDQGSTFIKLKKEYAVYRKRALQVVEEKELLLSDAQKKLSAVGISFEYRGDVGANVRSLAIATNSEHARRSASLSLEGEEDNTGKYLKNIVLKYMSTEQEEVSTHIGKKLDNKAVFINYLSLGERSYGKSYCDGAEIFTIRTASSRGKYVYLVIFM